MILSLYDAVAWLIKTTGILSLSVIAFFVVGVIVVSVMYPDDEEDE